MYVPPFDSILKSVGLDRPGFEVAHEVTIPKELFRLLLQVAVAASDFNEAGYLAENPDIAEALADGSVQDARMHYVGFGFFEGRLGATPAVDERWYLAAYNDVAQAVRSGKVASASEHYNVAGAAEGRSPSGQYSTVAAQWKRALVS